MKALVAILIPIVFLGCASSKGFNRQELRNSISSDVVITEQSIKAALEAKPQLSKPFRLAVYYASPKTTSYRYGSGWSWRPEEMNSFEAKLSELVSAGEVSEVISINSSIVEGKGNKSIRLAAARAGADAVLIVNGVADIDRYNNALGVTYILLVTAMFIPGTELDVLTMINASMWDVRNEYLYLSVDSEHSESVTAPAFFIEEEHVINKSMSAAMSVLGQEVFDRIDKMARK